VNIVDFFILLWAVAAIGRGIEVGFFRQTLSLVGFLFGLMAGLAMTSFVLRLIDGDTARLLVALVITLGGGLVLSAAGESAGHRLQNKLHFSPIRYMNKALGAFVSAMAVLVASWLIASVLDRLPTANLAVYIKQSYFIQQMNSRMPPAPELFARVGRILGRYDFPKAFVGQEPNTPYAGDADQDQVEAAARIASDSTVKIESFGCGGVASGSGFVIAEGFVVTNAHVVAGIRNPTVVDTTGHRRAVTVWFDKDKDLAVLRVDDVTGRPLELVEGALPSGTTVAVIGYPGGGRRTVTPGVIAGTRQALGRDIYDRNLSLRQIYELNARISQGNSGGPAVTADGRVAGVIFGQSVSDRDNSYALTSRSISADIDRAIERNQSASTGTCIR
jgi:S1-C subfamily serine protease